MYVRITEGYNRTDARNVGSGHAIFGIILVHLYINRVENKNLTTKLYIKLRNESG